MTGVLIRREKSGQTHRGKMNTDPMRGSLEVDRHKPRNTEGPWPPRKQEETRRDSTQRAQGLQTP